MSSKNSYDLDDLDDWELRGDPDSTALVNGIFLLIVLIIFSIGYFF